MADLWPYDIENTTQKAPSSILQEQASILGTKTKNLVKAEVVVGSPIILRMADLENKRDELGATIQSATKTSEELATTSSDKTSDISKDYDQLFIYDFFIVAPVLNNYRFRIFTVAYDFRLYPVRFYLDKDIQDQIRTELTDIWGRQNISARTEEELSSLLMQIFASRKVRRIINALMVQSGGSSN